ncbi:23S rRNA (uracil(1939)-C(5))-methyltransferase RlmD [Vibrio sinaloensis]|nr:23S rRNA (uracil(1939)-C(5))-methyltransferase RlmD [Vibrio sinaloensis]
MEAFATEHQASLYLMPESDRLERIVGEQAYYLEAGVTIPFEPNNFIQVNQQVNQSMVEQALDWLALDKQDRVLDLFCGLGNFSLPMAKRVKRVVGVEGVDAMVEKARTNAELNHLGNAHFFSKRIWNKRCLVSPGRVKSLIKYCLIRPERGASGIVEQLSELGATRVVYVSCNPATLARDSQSLLNQGFHLKKLGMLDMFPHTSHLESMALFL